MKYLWGFGVGCWSTILSAMIFVLFGSCSAPKPAPYQDLTINYQLPPELKDHKIFVLGGGWSATNPLWVVVPPQGLDKPLIIEKNN